MTKPEGISQSAWDEAGLIALQYVEWLVPKPTDYSDAEYVLATSIARAIMAATERERERAALIAEEKTKAGHQRNSKTVWVEQIGSLIAAAIRQGSQPSNVIPHRGTVK